MMPRMRMFRVTGSRHLRAVLTFALMTDLEGKASALEMAAWGFRAP